MELAVFEKEYPLFYKTCLYVQKFSFRNIFAVNEIIPINYELAEEMCSHVFALCNQDWDSYTKKVDILRDLDREFIQLQIELQRTGRYRYSTFAEVEKEFLDRNKTQDGGGADYLWGLYFSQIFWETHHRLFNFFLKEFVAKTAETGSCLEVPVGSGVFLAHFLSHKKNWEGVGVDLSESSIAISKKFMEVQGLTNRTTLIKKDIFEYTSHIGFDRIMCGELIEHVEDPCKVLRTLCSLLNKDGKLFLTTVACVAAIDHIYLYESANDIRAHIKECGFSIEQEFIQNIFPKDKDKIEEKGVALNYSAILVKQS